MNDGIVEDFQVAPTLSAGVASGAPRGSEHRSVRPSECLATSVLKEFRLSICMSNRLRARVRSQARRFARVNSAARGASSCPRAEIGHQLTDAVLQLAKAERSRGAQPINALSNQVIAVYHHSVFQSSSLLSVGPLVYMTFVTSTPSASVGRWSGMRVSCAHSAASLEGRLLLI